MNIGTQGPRFFQQVCHRYGDVIKALSADALGDLKMFYHWAQETPPRWSLLKEVLLPQAWYDTLEGEFLAHYKARPEALRVLRTLHLNGRMNVLPSILAYVHCQNSQQIPVYLYSNVPLSAPDTMKIARHFESELGASVKIYSVTNPYLVAGIVILWNHYRVDASLDPLFVHLKTQVNHVICAS